MSRYAQDVETTRPNERTGLTHKEAGGRYRACHDELTGLPNRHMLQNRFHQVVSQADRYHNAAALLMAELDDFKRIDATLGHVGSDKLLRAVAHRLARDIRGADTACRYGGDDFAILIPEINGPNIAATLAVDIGGRLSEPYIIGDQHIYMAIRMGVAVYPGDGQTFDDLMAQAQRYPFLCIFCRAPEKQPAGFNEAGGYRQAS